MLDYKTLMTPHLEQLAQLDKAAQEFDESELDGGVEQLKNGIHTYMTYRKIVASKVESALTGNSAASVDAAIDAIKLLRLVHLLAAPCADYEHRTIRR